MKKLLTIAKSNHLFLLLLFMAYIYVLYYLESTQVLTDSLKSSLLIALGVISFYALLFQFQHTKVYRILMCFTMTGFLIIGKLLSPGTPFYVYPSTWNVYVCGAITLGAIGVIINLPPIVTFFKDSLNDLPDSNGTPPQQEVSGATRSYTEGSSAYTGSQAGSSATYSGSSNAGPGNSTGNKAGNGGPVPHSPSGNNADTASAHTYSETGAGRKSHRFSSREAIFVIIMFLTASIITYFLFSGSFTQAKTGDVENMIKLIMNVFVVFVILLIGIASVLALAFRLLGIFLEVIRGSSHSMGEIALYIIVFALVQTVLGYFRKTANISFDDALNMVADGSLVSREVLWALYFLVVTTITSTIVDIISRNETSKEIKELFITTVELIIKSVVGMFNAVASGIFSELPNLIKVDFEEEFCDLVGDSNEESQ